MKVTGCLYRETLYFERKFVKQSSQAGYIEVGSDFGQQLATFDSPANCHRNLQIHAMASAGCIGDAYITRMQLAIPCNPAFTQYLPNPPNPAENV